MTELEKLRNRINIADKQMASIFCERMDAVKQIAEYKKLHGISVDDPVREAALIAKNSQLLENEDLKPYYVSFLKSNIEVSKKYQHRILEGAKVAFSGVNGAFADIAAKKMFPDACRVAYPNFKSAYGAALSGECDYAVLPIENSYNGDVGRVLDLAFFGSLYINGIFDMDVVQNLLGTEDATLQTVKTVISHPQALGQCAEFIAEHSYSEEETANTAAAAKNVADSGRNDIAAIASEEAAQRYGLKIIKSHINQSNANTTRFAVFSRSLKKPEDSDNRFIMFFTVPNVAGALGKAVSAVGENGFNLTALKSRPTKELIKDYYFFAEGEGNINTENGRKMLSELKEKCSTLKVVGSFKQGWKV